MIIDESVQLENPEVRYALIFWDTNENKVAFGLYEDDNKTISEFRYMPDGQSEEYLAELSTDRIGIAVHESETFEEEGVEMVRFIVNILFTIKCDGPEGYPLEPVEVISEIVNKHEGDFGFIISEMVKGSTH